MNQRAEIFSVLNDRKVGNTPPMVCPPQWRAFPQRTSKPLIYRPQSCVWRSNFAGGDVFQFYLKLTSLRAALQGACKKIVIIERVEFKAIRITLATTTQVNLAMFSIWGPGLQSNSHRRRLASKLQNLNLAFVCELFKSDPTHEESPRKKGR